MAKILSSRPYAEYLFQESEELERQLTPVVEALAAQYERKTPSGKRKAASEPSSLDFKTWEEQFQMLTNIALLTNATSTLRVKLLTETVPAAFDLLRHELSQSHHFETS